MRAFSSSRICVSIAIAIAAFVLGSLVLPGKAMAREPEYEMQVCTNSGGSSGGQEWKTHPTDGDQGLPVDRGKLAGTSPKYATGSQADVEASWAARVESWYTRLLNAVSAMFVKKYF
jgi:hypothetical protein